MSIKTLPLFIIICTMITFAHAKKRSRKPFIPYSIFVKQPNSEVVIGISKNRKGHIYIDYKSLTRGKKIRKRISRKNYRYFTKGFKKPLSRFKFGQCPNTYFIVNSIGECLDAPSSTAKNMRVFLRKVFNNL